MRQCVPEFLSTSYIPWSLATKFKKKPNYSYQSTNPLTFSTQKARGSEPGYTGFQASDLASYSYTAAGSSSNTNATPLMDQRDQAGEDKAKGLPTLTPTTSSARSRSSSRDRLARRSQTAPYSVPSRTGSLIGSRTYRGGCVDGEDGDSIASIESKLSGIGLGENIANAASMFSDVKGKGKATANANATEPFPPLANSNRPPISPSFNFDSFNFNSNSGDALTPFVFPQPPPAPAPAPLTAATFAAGLEQIDNEYARNHGLPQSSAAATSALNAVNANVINLMQGQGGDKLWDSSWYPDNKGYSAEKFFNGALMKYECPHGHCS